MPDIESKDLLVIDEYRDDERQSRRAIRVVQWSFSKKDGSRGTSIKLEKRNFFTKDGRELTGKAEGFNLFDMKKIRDKMDEIMALMENPDAAPAAPAAPAAAPQAKKPASKTSADIEEVPF